MTKPLTPTPRTIASGAVGCELWAPPPRSVRLVFDGYCGFCTRWVRLLQRIDRHNRVEPLAGQEPHTIDQTGITAAESIDSAWVVLPNGQRVAGAPAIATAVAVATGTRLPLVFWKLPVVPSLLDRLYRWIAANRRRFRGDTPWCEQHSNSGRCTSEL